MKLFNKTAKGWFLMFFAPVGGGVIGIICLYLIFTYPKKILLFILIAAVIVAIIKCLLDIFLYGYIR